MKQNKKIIISISLIILANGVAVLGWFYLFSAISGQVREVNEIRRNLSAVEKDSDDSRSLKILLDNIQDEKKKIDKVFLSKGTLIKFIEEIEGISEKSGALLEFSSIGINEKQGGANLRFNLSGEFSEIYRYLGLLENLPHQIIFEKAYIQSGDDDWTANFDIILTTYIL